MSNIYLTRGSHVVSKGREYTIIGVVDSDLLACRDIESSEPELVRISDIQAPATPLKPENDLATVPDHKWQTARERFEAISELLVSKDRRVKDVDSAARQAGVGRSTIYRWIQQWEQTGTLQSLIPGQTGGKGGSRLPQEVEAIIEEVIRDTWLDRRRIRTQVVVDRIAMECRRNGLKPPSYNSVAKRLDRIPNKVKARSRGGKAAVEKLQPAAGQFPGADLPLQVVQIDHTKLDIEIVDSELRRPIGRPWITMAIDVCSRMVTGFFLSLEPPSALSVGQVIFHSISRKDEWLAERSIKADWPVWGKPAVIHADNASEFRGNVVTRACQNHGIDIHWRPVAKPQFGAHIERLLGTLNAELSTLPGRTGNSIKDRGEYDPSENATFTLEELEAYITNYVCNVYHRRRHSGIATTPIRAYEEGIHGNEHKMGRGLPPMPADMRRLYLDFLPYYERTVQQRGVVIEGVHYYAPGLRRWIEATEEGNRTRKRKFVIRRDPRSIAKAWFLDPELKDYIELTYADLTLPDVSETELKAARRMLSKEGIAAVDEDALFEAVERLREMERESSRKTKAARRKRQRRKSVRRAGGLAGEIERKAENTDNALEDIPQDIPPPDEPVGTFDVDMFDE